MTKKIDQNTSSTLQWSFFSVLMGFLVFFGIIAFFWLLLDLLAPVLVALLLAFIFRPLINWTNQHWNWPAWLSLIVLLFLMTAIFTTLGIYLMPILIEQISQFIEKLPEYIENLLELIAGEQIIINEDTRDQLLDAAQKHEKIIPLILTGTVKSFNMIIKAFGTLSYIIIYIILLFVFFVTFCLRLPDLKNWCRQFLPRSHRDQIIDILQKIYDASSLFLRTRLIIAFLIGAFFSIGWAIAGVPYWLLLGTITGFLNIIPYASGLGWIAALLITGFEAASSGRLLYALLWPTVVFVIGQLLEGWFLTPYLEGEKLKIHPVIVLFTVLAGGTLAGLLGMLLAIPLTAAWQILFSDAIKPTLIHWAKKH